MEITFTLNLTQAEETELTNIIGCTQLELQTVISRYAEAALKEYLAMFRGQKVLKRGSDILEYRLFLLIESAFNGVIPDEHKICSLFQTTLTESRTLIRSVISKYQYQLKTKIDETIREILRRAQRQDSMGEYSVIINSNNMVNELNRLLISIDGSLNPVTKKKGSVSIYEIKESSYIDLCNRVGVSINP